MNSKKNNLRSGKTINRLFLLMIQIYLILLLIISAIACYYSYQEKKEQTLSAINMTLFYMEQEYSDILDNFWQAYMPIYEKNSSIAGIFQEYFSFSPAEDLTPIQKRDLSEALLQMKTRDSRIQWIGLYSENRDINYLQKGGSSGIEIMTEEFPYLEELRSSSSAMEIYQAEEMTDIAGASFRIFAVSGSSPIDMGPGRIIIGYSLSDIERSSDTSLSGLSSSRYYLISGSRLLFDSFGNYQTDDIYFPPVPGKQTASFSEKRLLIQSGLAGNNSSMVCCSIDWNELLLRSHRDTPLILSITILFTLLAFVVHIFMNRSVAREVAVIRDGLNRISESNLEYRLPTDFRQSGLPEIAQNINDMSDKLNENIKKAYYFELKQKDAQLAELQATFNPHFLYNTLEMLRSKSYSNGDMETASLISQLSALFRGFINAKTFISLKEELAFSNRYFTLLNARYGSVVEAVYDIPSELLDYGIIRNTFQLIIENYFVHGFDASREKENYIRFSGKSIDENTMLFCVEDNGSGMNEEDLEKLNLRIEQPIRHGDKSYGLKNLNQRLKLFYGPDCGLHITHGKDGGICVQMKMLKLTVEAYESKKQKVDEK